ncbi:MAG: cysteine desulfurase [Anaerolineaceae bacterium]|nr:cysteine desulfurase [Anaerolineaceae bacterium]MBN2678360.1 cysteine desulfurase [Anaerolineaceae bacterium]
MKIDGIYLDYNATTPCDPRVVEKMLPYFSEIFGNPANGLHKQGRLAAKAVDEAREQVAGLIGARHNEIVFTSGATESNNLAILGVARINRNGKRKRIVTCVIEHKAVLLACKKLIEEEFDVVFLPVDSDGKVLLDAAREAINDNTLLVSVQGANNEIGTIQPISQLVELAHKKGALFHCDAAQAVGKIQVSIDEWDVDLLSMSAHKLYGPKGIGALYVRGGPRAIPIEPIWYGGGQENGLRSGTSNVPSIVGFGEACQICQIEVLSEGNRIQNLHDALETDLRSAIHSIKVNGILADRLPNTSNLTLPGIDADALLLNTPQVMIGTGSACSSGAVEQSHVLTAIGLSRLDALSTIRISLGRYTNKEDILSTIPIIVNAYQVLSEINKS